MTKVSLRRCDDYSQDKVDIAIQNVLDDIGGIDKFISPHQKVLIKTNLLMKKRPDDQVTTNPAILIGVINALHNAGIQNITIADSPGGPFNDKLLYGVYKAAGILDVKEKTNVNLNYDTGMVEDFFDQGVILKQLMVCKFLKDADVVINCAKLKTHGMTGYTGAVKNLFGVVPGTVKVEYHYRMSKLKDFSNMLCDLALYVHPDISIIDGVVGMEGNGPSAGLPRKVGAIIASENPFCADMVGISLMNEQPKNICTIKRAMERNLITGNLANDVQIIGDDLKSLVVKDFKKAKVADVELLNNRAPKFVAKFARNVLTSRPQVNEDICVGCGVCMNCCPAKSITMVEGVPHIDKKTCIKCFCCHELCPKKAMGIKRPILTKLIK